MNDIDATEVVERENLATIQIIQNFYPIEGKDFIELCDFKSCAYKAVVQRGLHKAGDKVLVVRYDSVLPDIPMFEFMRDMKFRVKVKSFSSNQGKLYSQCIVIPLEQLNGYFLLPDDYTNFDEEQDLTEVLKITKYIRPMVGSGNTFGKMNSIGGFPTHLLSKTDEVNCLSKRKALEELRGLPYQITLKLDGSSMSCLINPSNDEFYVCSRNNIIREDETNSFWKVAKHYNIESILRENPTIALQLELCGQKVQSNKMSIEGLDGYVFNVIDINTRRQLDTPEAMDFCDEYGLKYVPVIDRGIEFDFTIDELVQMTMKKYSDYGFVNSKSWIEGIVIRPMREIFSPTLKDTLSVKVICPEFK